MLAFVDDGLRLGCFVQGLELLLGYLEERDVPKWEEVVEHVFDEDKVLGLSPDCIICHLVPYLHPKLKLAA